MTSISPSSLAEIHEIDTLSRPRHPRPHKRSVLPRLSTEARPLTWRPDKPGLSCCLSVWWNKTNHCWMKRCPAHEAGNSSVEWCFLQVYSITSYQGLSIWDPLLSLYLLPFGPATALSSFVSTRLTHSPISILAGPRYWTESLAVICPIPPGGSACCPLSETSPSACLTVIVAF